MPLFNRLAISLRDALFRRRVVVLSEPFYSDGKWQLLSGDEHGFVSESFQTWEQANDQYQSTTSLVAIGDPLYDFIVIQQSAATLISDSASYRRALRSSGHS